MLGGGAVPWWIAGGWAIDLFTGRRSRPHADLDIGCFRQDLPALLELFDGWDSKVVGTHVLFLRPMGSDCWVLEVLIEERAANEWVYRRDERIRRPADGVVLRDREGIPYLRPEIQLLYKSKQPRGEDEQDFRAAWPLLTPDARVWLLENLGLASPGHAWLQGEISEGERR